MQVSKHDPNRIYIHLKQLGDQVGVFSKIVLTLYYTLLTNVCSQGINSRRLVVRLTVVTLNLTFGIIVTQALEFQAKEYFDCKLWTPVYHFE